MIEFTYTELALFIWGAVATAYAFKQQEAVRTVGTMLRKLIETPELYYQIHNSWKVQQEDNNNAKT